MHLSALDRIRMHLWVHSHAIVCICAFAYAYVDVDSNGTKFYGNITVIPELHVTAGFQDNTANANNQAKDEDENSDLLLIIAAASAIGALVLGGMIYLGNEEK